MRPGGLQRADGGQRPFAGTCGAGRGGCWRHQRRPALHPQAPLLSPAAAPQRVTHGSRTASSTHSNGSSTGGTASSDGAAATRKKRGGSKPSPVPDVDAEQLLRTLGLSGAADPAALLTNLRKLPGVRQQGVLDNAVAVAAHLCSPTAGLTAQQAGQLLEHCPALFSWPPEQRAAVLFGELLGAGVAEPVAAACFMAYPEAAERTYLKPGLAELAAILAHSEDRDSSLGGAAPKVPAVQRTVAALLTQKPSAVQLVCQNASYLQQRAAGLQQAGFSAAQVAGLTWQRPELFTTDAAAKLASRAALVQEEIGLPLIDAVSLAAKSAATWSTASKQTVQERAAALAEGFGWAAAAAMLLKSPAVLNCPPAVWRRNLCYMAACGVADPKAVLRQCPLLLPLDHAAPDLLQRRLILQHTAQLTAVQLYEQHPRWLYHRKVPDLVQRLQFAEHRGRDMRQLLTDVLYKPLEKFLAAAGASEAEWEAWAAANPPDACPLYRWAQAAAAEEAARLAAALPPELAQWERRPHSAAPRSKQQRS